MLGIMAGMDQEAWFAVFDVVPRAVLFLVSLAPDARHHGRLGPQDSVEVKSRVGGHISRVVGHSFGVEGHSPRVGGHSSRVEGHSSRVGGHSCCVGGHSSRVAEHSPRVGGHSSGVCGHSYRVGEHSSRVGGHSSRFGGHISRVGGHISRVGGHRFLWAIQTFSCGGSFARVFRECEPKVFLCGGSKLPFGNGVFQSRHSFRLPLSLGLALVAMFTGAVGSPLDCKFRGMCLCAWPSLSWCLPFASLVRDMWWFRCSGFLFLLGFFFFEFVLRLL